MKITLIMPLYNVENYLERAFRSIEEQSIGMENLHILMVDDCSTDGTYAMADSIAKKHKNIELFQTLKNSGSAGVPRNLALSKVVTPYLMFLDPDDWLTKDACKILYQKAEEYHCKLVKGSCIINGKKFEAAKRDTLLQKMEEMVTIPMQDIGAQLYSTEVVKQHQVSFSEGMTYEDNEFYYRFLMNIDQMLCIKDLVHYYNTRDRGIAEGLAPGSVTRQRDFHSLYSLVRAYEKIRDILEEKNPFLVDLIKEELYQDLLWKISITGELNKVEEQRIGAKIAWLRDRVERRDTKDEILFQLLKKEEINLVGLFFRYVTQEVSLKKILIRKLFRSGQGRRSNDL